MCGILGIATTAAQRPMIERRSVERMRDLMEHRGPDGAGLWGHPEAARVGPGNVILAHRRLAVLDTSDAAAQPMSTPDGRFVLVYSGELYNDLDLRRELAAAGATFRSHSDTETVLLALARWGSEALARFRGMFALAFFDSREQSLLLARDPLGIKPLYYFRGTLLGRPSLVFASEIPAILAHPELSARPDLVTVSAYLTTIRTVLGARTLFQDVSTLRPGEALQFRLNREQIDQRTLGWSSRDEPATAPSGENASLRVRAAIEDSLDRHLRADVPICCLLSGGLDSSILATLAMRRLGSLQTYCSGAAASCEQVRGSREHEDFAFAKRLAAGIGAQHREAPITPRLFASHWRRMVRAQGIPLSTPNETAIYEVARSLREDGNIVALSGEGADELFAGYVSPMTDAHAYVNDSSSSRPHPGHFQLNANAWIKPELKPTILNDRVWRAVERDGHLLAFYESEFDAVAAERDDDTPLQAHLRFHRRINLAGLLQRLDSATMLASVEGRTPFADSIVCQLAESLPMHEKFTPAGDAGHSSPQSKRVLREAFGPDLPPDIVSRPKASFPLPFQEWVADQASCMQQCSMMRDLFTRETLHAVSDNPGRLWHLSWPMINIALWAQRWWD